MNSALLIAFDFPPRAGSSGLQRTLSFTRHLVRHPQWQPVLLTCAASAYPEVDNERVGDIPPELIVHRVPALDSKRHLGIRGRYLSYSAIPDRWITWFITGVPVGMFLIMRYRPRVIWSTYPIATAHLIACTLARVHNIPWICDFRDPMVKPGEPPGEWEPSSPLLRRARLGVERAASKTAARVVFCTPSARRLFLDRYPEYPPNRAVVIENGFEEDVFQTIEAAPKPGEGPVRLVHSGTLYSGSDRDPSAFLQAIRNLLESRELPKCGLEVILRASGSEAQHSRTIERFGLQRIVRLEPLVSYRSALAEMLGADVLLLLQGRASNTAIPAKVYEYLRARKPILALVDPAGDTADLLRTLDVGVLAPLQSPEVIESALRTVLRQVESQDARVLSFDELSRLNREHRCEQMIALFEDIANDEHPARIEGR